MNTPKIILASQSLGRRTLLTQLGVQFEIMVSDVDEDAITHQDATQTLKQRAIAKADKIAKKLSSNYELQATNYLIIAADSSAIIDNEIFGKVRNSEEAHTMVRALMGKTHDFATATSIRLIENGKEIKKWNDVAHTAVTLRTMNDIEIDQYLTRYDFTRFAACYTFNETPWDWITKLDGSFTNVIGLPFEVLLPILRETNIF